MVKSEITFERTPKGIPVVTETIENCASVGYMAAVNTGSRDECPEIWGISHLLEHVVFRATKTRSSFQISKEMEGAGGEINAFTGKELTAFYGVTLEETASTAKDMVSDIVCNPLINPDDVEMEKKIVLQEISMCENNPDSYIHDLFSETIWAGHDLGHNEAGTVDIVKGLGSKELRDYYSEKYVIPNMAVFACGAVTPEDAMEWACQHFDEMPAGNRNVRTAPKIRDACYNHIQRKEDHCYVAFGFPAYSADHKDKSALALLNSILGSGSSSRMFQQVREEKALVYSVYNSVDQNSDAGSIGTYFSSTEENVLEAIETVAKVYRELKDGEITVEELNKARNLVKGATVRYMESTDHRLYRMARGFMLTGKPETMEERMANLNNVTVEDIMRVAEDVIRNDRLTITMYGNKVKSMKKFDVNQITV